MTNRNRVSRTSVILLAIFALILASSFHLRAAADDSIVVQTTSGQLRGVPRSGGGARFLGVPYARPPIGDLRWHEPLPAKPWSGVRDASTFSAPCAQPILGDWNRHDAESGSEDCLYLNVVTPQWPVKKPLPVMFWIHGGGNEGGSGIGDLYNSGTLVNHGVLLVTINYRLGIFGFFAHPALTRQSPHHASGNYGLMDQILALRWVRDNIANFGGDPHNITVFGQSAGAMDTGMLMASLARDLFQKAIAESGSPFSPPLATLAEAEKNGETLASDLKAPSGDAAIASLRKLSAQDLLAALANLPRSPRPRVGPDVDGWVLQRLPAQVFAAGQESPIPLIFGTTAREFGGAASPDELRAMIQHAAGDSAPQALATYGLANGGTGTTDPKYGTASDQWPADVAFRCPATAQGIWHTAARHPAYEYELDHPIPGQENAVHSSDLPYVFGFFPKSGNIAGNFSDTDTKLADLVETYFTNFAKTGDPNSPNVPPWPKFGSSQSYIQFMPDGSVVPATALRSAQCTVLREFLSGQPKQ